MFVKVNTDVLKDEANNVDGYLDHLLLESNCFLQDLEDISNQWDGNDHDGFNDKMLDLYNELSEFKDSINSYNIFIRGYANIMDTTNSTYKEIKLK